MPDPVRRDGELTEESLADALMDERDRGNRPTQVAVGSEALRLRALRILDPKAGALDDLRGVVPNVAVYPTQLGAGEWELRGS